MGKIKFISGGLLTTIQDLGRFGYQKFGMPVSGAMDIYSLQLANWLAGNKRNEACFEITYLGPEIEFISDSCIAICGAPMKPTLDDMPIEMNTTLQVPKGNILKTGAVTKGMRAYLAIAGGIQVPEVMGSKSTYLRGKIGGHQGRKIEAGDILETGDGIMLKNRTVPKALLHIFPKTQTVRIIQGTEIDRFDAKSFIAFLDSEYTISNQNDRMGYRLAGPAIAHKNGADIISSGITNGSVQVPGHGEPIIMMADHQTVGGYTKIATVISVDLPILGQMKAGDKIRFKEIDLESAQDLIRKQEQNFEKLYQSS